jgi:hypothetical protein
VQSCSRKKIMRTTMRKSSEWSLRVKKMINTFEE